MNESTPQFGQLLAPVLARVPDAARPRFLALLERTAADRYRVWADALPEHREELLGCAASEDAIADIIESAFDCDEATMDILRGLLPEARALYYAAFDGVDIHSQLAMQADAELQGAAAWRHIAARIGDGTGSTARLAALARCSELEERSSEIVRSVVLAAR